MVDKLHDLQRLEASVKAINSLFIELSQLLENQTETLGSIEYAVINTKNYTSKAQNQLTDAKNKQRRKMRCYIWTCYIITVIVGVVILVNFLKYGMNAGTD